MSISIVLAGCLLSPPNFASPVPLRANGEVINVFTGHAAPYLYDFDGDGVRDLLVGEFGVGNFKGETTEEASAGHPWTAGKLRFYKNHGSEVSPLYKDWSYVQAGDQDAQVPITCCVSFVPQFIDIDGDGDDDLLSGSYPGDVYFYMRNASGKFDAPILQRNIDGEPVRAKKEYKGKHYAVHSITTELHDMDGDDDLDMVIGSRLDGCFVIENVGDTNAHKWASMSQRLKSSDGKPIGGWDYGSNVHFFDWDADGVSDILVGSEDGNILWHRNEGTQDQPVFGAMQMLVEGRVDEERFRKLETPMKPAWRVKVHAADYDGDGLTDLLVGDFGSSYTRNKKLTAEQKKRKRELNEQLDAHHEKSRVDLQGVSDNAEREKYFDESSKITSPMYDELEELETHKSKTIGWVWFYKQLPAQNPAKTTAVLPAGSKSQAVSLTAQGLNVSSAVNIPLLLAISLPEGWTATGNAAAVEEADSFDLPTSIEWTLPEGCSIVKEIWQDADEHAHYEGKFTVEAIVDTSGMSGTAHIGDIGAHIRYQRCSKKSGVCILEQTDVVVDG